MHGTAIPPEITKSLSIFHEDMRADAVLRLFIFLKRKDGTQCLALYQSNKSCVCVRRDFC